MQTVDEILKTAINSFLHDGPRRGVELVTMLTAFLHEEDLARHNINIVEFINQMVKDKELVELEYVLPSMSYRIKSLYFIKGTTLQIVK